MAGGVLAALAGPQLAAWSKDLFAPAARANLAQAGRLLRRPVFGLAMAAAMVAYAAMNLVMTATPVAVMDCHLPFAAAAAAFVIQWHVFAMHAPSFFTGDLIRRLADLIRARAPT